MENSHNPNIKGTTREYTLGSCHTADRSDLTRLTHMLQKHTSKDIVRAANRTKIQHTHSHTPVKDTQMHTHM